jgi:two-component system KDP operon response regulator KdpE
VQLTPTEYDMLKALITARGKVLTGQQLLRQMWGIGYGTELHMLRVNILTYGGSWNRILPVPSTL